MPPTYSARCWAALCGKWPELADKYGTVEPEMILAGTIDACQKARPDMVNGVPPTLFQVEAYLTEINSRVIAQEFMDHYDMVGWIVGSSKVKMKDWRAACRLWHRRLDNGTTPGKRAQGSASLFALQAQLKTVEGEMESIMYPGGSAMKHTPEGKDRVRFNKLAEQRHALKAQIDGFAIG